MKKICKIMSLVIILGVVILTAIVPIYAARGWICGPEYIKEVGGTNCYKEACDGQTGTHKQGLLMGKMCYYTYDDGTQDPPEEWERFSLVKLGCCNY